MTDFAAQREKMVERQIAARGIHDPDLLRAMREVPREAFVPADLAGQAYEDMPLPIEAGQTISQPYIVALMIEAAGDRAGRQGARDRRRLGLCRGGDGPDRGSGDRDREA